MIDGLLGKKVGMTQVFTETGVAVPVTVVELGPNVVTQLKTLERDGYSAVQVGFGETKRLNKPEAGHLKTLPRLKHLREFRCDNPDDIAVGQQLDASMFAKGDKVDIVGTSKGKGFAGVVKRHGFAGGPKTHGQSDRHRAPGSIGASATPGRVFKGMRMAGHLGNVRRTVQNLEVIDVYPDRNVLLVKGSIPGPKNQLVVVRKAIKTNRGRRAETRS
jgi:large subunit ribosomal protein L3